MSGRNERAVSSERRRAAEGNALLTAQGGFRSHRRAAWRIGAWSLLPRRLVFGQSDRRVFDLPLDKIAAIALERSKFILVHKPVIRLTYLHPRKNGRQNAWLIVADVNRWMETLRLLTGVGAEAADDQCDSSSGLSSRQSGESPNDAASGNDIARATLRFEVHDEARALLVVADVPGLKNETLRTEVHGRNLRLAAETAHGPCTLCIPLPCGVRPQPAELKIANDVLSVRLIKVAWR